MIMSTPIAIATAAAARKPMTPSKIRPGTVFREKIDFEPLFVFDRIRRQKKDKLIQSNERLFLYYFFVGIFLI